MSDVNLAGIQRKVAYLMDNFPETRHDHLLLLLAYWKVYDGIAIPDSLMKEISDKATAPESIARLRRKTLQFFEVQETINAFSAHGTEQA